MLTPLNSSAGLEALYRRLRQRALQMAKALGEGRTSTIPELAYISHQADLILKTVAEEPLPANSSSCLAEMILQWMSLRLPFAVEDYPGSAAIRLSLLEEFGPIFWERLMVEAPLGEYARFCAAAMKERGWLGGEICELGAGAGALSRLIGDSCRLTRTDLYASFLDGRWSQDEFLYDFNQPFAAGRKFAAVVAVNALHCANDRVQSLKNIRAMLGPGGRLVFCEGQNFVRGEEPWALNILCFPFVGWVECGGFVSEEQWRRDLQTAGFVEIESEPLRAGPFHIGNLLTATSGL